MHKLLVMDELKGHVETPFAPPDVTTEEAIRSRKIAEDVFNEVMARPGWTVIVTAPTELEGEKLTQFDPRAEEAIAFGPFAGG